MGDHERLDKLIPDGHCRVCSKCLVPETAASFREVGIVADFFIVRRYGDKVQIAPEGGELFRVLSRWPTNHPLPFEV